jgi:hypothetical protein
VVRLLGDGWDVVSRGKDGGGVSGGGWRPRWREKKKEREGCLQENRAGKAYFVPTFELSFANRLSMKIDPIYRAGQRVISSSMGKTSQPLIRLE